MINELNILVILLLPAAGSFISYVIGRKSEHHRNIFNITVTAILLVLVSALYKPVSVKAIEVFIPDIMGTGLYLKLDMFRYIFVWITVFIWFLATIYSTKYLIKYKNRNRYYSFFMLTLGSTIGIFLSENLFNLFTFFEIMSITSYILVIHDEDQYAHEAGRSYLGMAIAGGLVLLMGLFLLYDYTGTLNISELSAVMKHLGSVKYLISALIIIGFGVKASMAPLHVWLPKAHPAAPAPASAVLSAILVKTGIFGILVTAGILMKDDLILSSVIFISGLVNMFMGGLLAIFQRNIKRILAYSSMSQMGYILMGIGLIGLLGDHKVIAVYGTLYHIVNHAMYKVLLFLGAGIIYMILHDLSINEIRGFGKHKPVLKILFLIGICAVTGVPGFNGFASKTLLHEALLEARHIYDSGWFLIAEMIFTVSSGLTAAYLLKIFVAVFMEKNEKYCGQYKNHIYKRVKAPLVVLSGVIIYTGMRPGIFINVMDGVLPVFNVYERPEVHFYTLSNINAVVVSMVLGVGIYFCIVRKYLRKQDDSGSWYVNPSLQWFSIERNVYSPVIRCIFRVSSIILHEVDHSMINMVKAVKLLIRLQVKYIYRKKRKAYKNISLMLGKEKNDSHYFKDMLDGAGAEMHDVVAALNKLRSGLNSVTYSTFIFATILVLVLLVMLNI